MEKLSPEDYRRILAAIEILGSDADFGSFPERAIGAIGTVIEVDFISYNEVDLAAGTRRFLIRPDVRAMNPDSSEYTGFVRRFGHHPIVAEQISTVAPARPAMEQFLRRIRMLGMVGNCCGQAELRLNLGLTVTAARQRMVGIAINRSIRDFDDQDAERLAALRPHIVAAYKTAMRLAEGTSPALAGPPGGDALTRRESQVLYWVAMGKTNDEVGQIIGAKPLTVKKHLEHIYDKLGVPNRTAAARAANLSLALTRSFA